MPSASQTRERRRAELLRRARSRGGCARPPPRARPASAVAERAELVGDRAVARGRRVVLERVRVHRVEPEPERRRRTGAGPAASSGSSHGTCRLTVRFAPVRALSAATSSSFSSIVRGSPPPGKRPKRVPPVPSAHDGAATLKRAHLVDHALGVDALELEQGSPPPRAPVRAGRCLSASSVAIVSAFSCTSHLQAQRGNAAGMPPSTGMNVPVVTLRSPPTSAATASATCSGRISVFSSVRSA